MDLGARRRRLRVHAAVPLERAAWSGGRRRSSTACVGRARPPVLARRGGSPTSATTARRTSTTRASRSRTSSSTPEQPDDADNPLRRRVRQRGLARGRRRVRAALRRRRDRRVRRDRGWRRGEPRRRGARRARSARSATTCRSSTRTATSSRAPRFDADGRLLNADECVGEIVNTAGAGRSRATTTTTRRTSRRSRFGWYWSGDLGYLDDDRLPLLRRPQRRLDPGRRRELPGAARSRRRSRGTPTSCSPRSTACPTTRPATR